MDLSTLKATKHEATSVFILGDFIHEGLRAKVEALGYKTTVVNLKTGPKHWARMAAVMRDLIDRGALAAAFAYLPTPTLLRVGEERYEDVLPLLIEQLERTTSLVFVYEQNLGGVIQPPPWEYYSEEDDWNPFGYYAEELKDLFAERQKRSGLPTRDQWFSVHRERIHRAENVIQILASSTVELVPFSSRNEVTIRIFEALEDREKGVFLRMYVPHGRFQSEQFKNFLDLFSRYFREVEHREFAIDAQRSRRGTTYVFRSRDQHESINGLREAIHRFEDFMDVVQENPEKAETLLAGGGLSISAAREVIASYSKAYRRLLLDARHELDQKKLILSQQMESDLLEAGDSRPMPSLHLESTPSAFQIIGNRGSIVINAPTGDVQTGPRTSAFVGQLINGDVTYTNEEKHLLSLIDELQDDVEALRLKSELDILKDEATSADKKQTAAQRLKAFLYKAGRAAGKKVDEISTKVLIAYLEALATGKISPN